MKVLVTGASGFIASHLLPSLLAKSWYVRGAVRNEQRLKQLPCGVEGVVVGEMSAETDWSRAAKEVDVIVHLAARVHIMHDSAAAAYEGINASCSRALAETAAALGVKRLVFVSSVKAMGESGVTDRPWTEEDQCLPQDSYGRSKRHAELALLEIAKRTGLQVVILRPPVVYGPGVRANIYRLLQIVGRGWLLPLASVRNRRSFLFVGNLVDAIVTGMEHSRAPGETFLVSDGKDLSTPELIRAIARAFGKSARLVPFPPTALRLTGRVLGMSAELERLLGSLTVDIAKIRSQLGWQPSFSVDEGLARTVRWFREADGHIEA